MVLCALSAYLGIHDLNKLKFYIFPQNFKTLAIYSLIYLFICIEFLDIYSCFFIFGFEE